MTWFSFLYFVFSDRAASSIIPSVCVCVCEFTGDRLQETYFDLETNHWAAPSPRAAPACPTRSVAVIFRAVCGMTIVPLGNVLGIEAGQ